jgi:hypothetical protein
MSETVTSKNPSVSGETLKTPFETIALAFSGGGFRAASFSLGALSYLNHIRFNDHTKNNKPSSLLDKVTYISSASGGTITNAVYALHSKSGKSFGEFYKKLYEDLKEDHLLNNTLEILSRKKYWKERNKKSRNLINSFALAYDKYLFDGKTLEELKPSSQATHLEEVCFNCTEFYRGLLFRQTVKMKSDPLEEKDEQFLFGNFVLNLDHKIAAKLKIADMLAASSCFPAGFEPIIFPRDFLHEGLTSEEKIINGIKIDLRSANKELLDFLSGPDQKTMQQNYKTIKESGSGKSFTLSKLKFGKKTPEIGFMDGGITDNQGIESMMKANERREHGQTSFKPFDLMMANDVGSHYMDPYDVPGNGKSLLGRLSINDIMIILSILFIGGVSTFFLLPIIKNHILYNAFFALATLFTSAGGFTLFLIFRIINKLKGKAIRNSGSLNLTKNFSDTIVNRLVTHLRRTPFNVLMQMVRARLSSVLILNNDVFLKRIRQLLYSGLFEASKGSFKVKGNRVYDLSFTNAALRKEHTITKIEPGYEMQKVAENAFSMATTLWFDKIRSMITHKQASLVATGQFTTCYNLLEYTHRLKESEAYKQFDPDYKKRVNDLYELLLGDFTAFNKDPFMLYNKFIKEYYVNTKELSSADIPLEENYQDLFGPTTNL